MKNHLVTYTVTSGGEPFRDGTAQFVLSEDNLENTPHIAHRIANDLSGSAVLHPIPSDSRFDGPDGDASRMVFQFTAGDSPVVVLAVRASVEELRGRGRPKGTTRGGRTMEPHTITVDADSWAWLESQPGGASEAIRKFVESANKS
jgi:hypothetical protein